MAKETFKKEASCEECGGKIENGICASCGFAPESEKEEDLEEVKDEEEEEQN